MADLIDRQVVIDAITNAADKWDCPDDYQRGIKAGIRIGTLISSVIPSVQPEIIHCRECRFWDPFPSSSSAPEYHQCKRFGGGMTASRAYDYCSRAEQREVSE